MLVKMPAAALLLLPLAASASPVAPRAPQEAPVTVTVDTAPESPTPATWNWAEGWKADFPIHASCNVTLRNQLEAGLKETVQIAAHARDHLLRWGGESDLAKKYFGNASVAGPIGWYSRVVHGNKDGMLFRCDDPDGNCHQDGWAGHWRGDNATQETVICDLSYRVRQPLSAVCNNGYTVAQSPLNTYWATDLLHRLFHVPLISDLKLEHFAEDYAEVVELAKTNPEQSVFDSDTLQYFAIDAWAYDIAAPGVGCTGQAPDATSSDDATETTATAPTSTPDDDDDSHGHCHTHADGTEHCS